MLRGFMKPYKSLYYIYPYIYIIFIGDEPGMKNANFHLDGWLKPWFSWVGLGGWGDIHAVL